MRVPDIRIILHGSPNPLTPEGEMEGPQELDSADYFADKKVILFGLPGAFTPTCTNEQLPAFEDLYDKITGDLGIDEIYCTAVNDDFVMEAWAKHLKIEKVQMIPDGNGYLADGLGMLVKKTNLGFGNRSWRYAAYVVDGVVELMLEEDGMCHNHDEDPYEQSTPLNVYNRIKEHLGIQDEESE